MKERERQMRTREREERLMEKTERNTTERTQERPRVMMTFLCLCGFIGKNDEAFYKINNNKINNTLVATSTVRGACY